MSNEILRLENIEKYYSGSVDKLHIIRNLNLSVEEGEFISILGRSGSGKSTVLRCATMLETISDGEILYLGKKAAWIENGKPVFPKKEERKEKSKNHLRPCRMGDSGL